MLTYRSLTSQQYVDRLMALIQATEQFAPNNGKPKQDPNYTIGYGYTFDRNNNVAIWQASGIPLSAADLAVLAQVDAAPSTQKNAVASAFSLVLTQPQAVALLRHTYPEYEGPANTMLMPSSIERVALVGLTYNRGAGSVTGRMQGFIQAIAQNDRAEAWFQMRYMSWGRERYAEAGLRKARYLQSEVFGLYDNPTSVGTAEAQAVVNMLTRNRSEILRLEALWGAPPDGTSATRNLIGLANSDPNYVAIATVQTLVQSLAPARDAFVAWVNSLLPADRQVNASAVNAAALYYTPSTTGSTTRMDASADDGRALQLENNLIVGGAGDDALFGGAGNDTLIGAEGKDWLHGGTGADQLFGGAQDDVLYGKTGDDVLYGGDGQDLYLWNAGDGNDTIVDPDGGQLIVRGTGYQFGGGVMFKDGQSNRWVDPTGNVVLTHNSPWRIELPDGSVIQLGEDFEPTEWGITLDSDIPPVVPIFVATGDQQSDPNDELYAYEDPDGDGPIVGHYVADARLSGASGDDTVVGWIGSDILEGNTGSDVVLGDGGQYLTGDGPGDGDRIYSDSEIELAAAITQGVTETPTGLRGDWLGGEDGDDIVVGGAGNDVLMGGRGTDTLVGGAGDDVLDGDDDYVPVHATQWSLGAFPGNEFDVMFNSIVNLNRADDLGSDDILYGGAGNDHLLGEMGDDQLYGEIGNDTLAGGDGGDILVGSEGDDRLSGDWGRSTNSDGRTIVQGDDYLDGGVGNDFLQGEGGSDEIFGGAGNDELWGDAKTYSDASEKGNDYLDGEDGNDDLIGQGGADTLIGGAGDDLLFGDVDGIAAIDEGDDWLDAGDGADYLRGYGGDDVLLGGSGDDQLQGDAGNDTLDGGAGVDYLDGGAGDDTYRIAADQSSSGLFRDAIYDTSGSDTLQLDGVGLSSLQVAVQAGGLLELTWSPQQSVLIDQGLTSSVSTVIAGGESTSLQRLVNERLTSSQDIQTARDGGTVLGGAVNDTITVNHAGTRVAAGGGNDVIDLRSTAGATVLATVGQGMDQVLAVHRDVVATPGAQNVLELEEEIDAAALRIYLVGGNTFELSLNGQGDGIGFTAGDGSLPIALSDWPFDVVRLTDGTEILWQEILDRGVAANSVGTEGNDLVSLTPSDDTFSALGGDDHVEGLAGSDNLSGDSGNDWVSGGDGNDSLDGGDGADALFGDTGTDMLSGGAGNDSLQGGDGDDRIDGGSGDDDLTGFNGSDTYLFGIGQGHDRIIGSVTTSVPGVRDTVEFAPGVSQQDISVVRGQSNALVITIGATGDSLTYDGFSWEGSYGDGFLLRFADGSEVDIAEIRALSLAGNDTNQVLQGYGTNDVIDAAGGNDTVDGAAGDDTLAGGSGDDYVEGNYGDDEVIGGSGNDTVSGFLGNDRIDGGAGNDLLYGGGGSDTFVFGIGSGNDTINDQDTTTAKLDTVSLQSGISVSDVSLVRNAWDMVLSVAPTGDTLTVKNFFLADVVPGPSAEAYRIDQILFSGGPNWDIAAIKARALDGNDLPQLLTGYATNDSVSAAAGNDTVYGEGGDDTLDGGQGNDEIHGGSDADLLLGAAGDDRLFGDDGNDQLDGGLGNDVLSGGEGSDTYLFGIGSGTDRIDNYDPSVGRVDRIVVSAGVTLADLDIRRSFNSLVITVVGTGDSLTVSGFYDSVVSEVNFMTLADETTFDAAALKAIAAAAPDLPLTLIGTSAADSLVGAGADDSLSGLAGNDTLTGNAGNDLLDGGTGSDSMRGNLGDDIYIVDVAGDVVTELANEGVDTVQSSLSWTLGSSSDLENLVLTGTSAINGTGNTLANTLTGNSAANTLSGGSGADTLIGAAGNDTYVVDNTGDVVTELAGEGTDLVQSSVSHTLAANVENLTLTGTSGLAGTGNTLDNLLTGNSGANTLTGGAGNDRLNGGSGTDTMIGGVGDDTYVVNVSSDVVTELAGEGTDTIESAVTLTLGSGNTVENLTLTGSSTLSATGNGLNNVLIGNSGNNTLTGNAGNDTLNGGTGTDTMRGGTGDDTYVVERSADSITEIASEGIDTVLSSLVWTLGNNLENLTLTGNSAFNGTGNTLANVLIGNGGANTLQGLAGNDTYDGGAGNDALTDNSTTSNDVYRWGIGSGTDTIADSGGTDRVELGAGITAGQVVFTRVGNNLELTVSGNSSDKLVVSSWYLGTANRIEDFRLSDGSSVPAGQVPLSLAVQRNTADAGSEPALQSQRVTIQPVRAAQAREAAASASAPAAWQLQFKAAAVDLWADALNQRRAEQPWRRAVHDQVGQSGQVHALISAMAGFDGVDKASADTGRQTIMPVRPEPMWVSPALMV